MMLYTERQLKLAYIQYVREEEKPTIEKLNEA